MQRLGFILWLAVCVAAQLVAAAVPQGVTMCVRSVMGLSGEVTLGQGETDDCCGGCCCDEDEGACKDEVPAPGPCREQGCMLCLSVPAATVGGTKAEVRQTSEWTWAVFAVEQSWAVRFEPERRGARLHPWPSAPPRCGAALVGCVILQV